MMDLAWCPHCQKSTTHSSGQCTLCLKASPVPTEEPAAKDCPFDLQLLVTPSEGEQKGVVMIPASFERAVVSFLILLEQKEPTDHTRSDMFDLCRQLEEEIEWEIAFCEREDYPEAAATLRKLLDEAEAEP